MNESKSSREGEQWFYLMNKVRDYEWDPASRENVKCEATIEILRHGRGWGKEDK